MLARLSRLSVLLVLTACSTPAGIGGGGGTGWYALPDSAGPGSDDLGSDTATGTDAASSTTDVDDSTDATLEPGDTGAEPTLDGDNGVTDAGPTSQDAEQDWANYFDPEDAGSPDVGVNDAGPVIDDGCIERAKIVYLVSSEGYLHSFTPDTLKLKIVGKLNCPAQFGGSPFSMSVDRQADAWVLYQAGFGGSGSIFKVSTLDASCQKTAFQPGQAGLDLFGMGFAANFAGSQDETLYIAGGDSIGFMNAANTLATLSFPQLKVSTVATLGAFGGADLTGNGLGELYGFFPSTSPPSVRQIDKLTGATKGKTYPLPPANFAGTTAAWAFAQWGGSFYLFFKNGGDPSTNVWQLNGATGAVKIVMPNIGYTITGAGVSSCAPTQATAP